MISESCPQLLQQCSVPKLSEVLARVEGEELGAACKVLAVTVTDMDTYRSDVGDDEEFKLARDSNKVGQIVVVVATLTHTNRNFVGCVI